MYRQLITGLIVLFLSWGANSAWGMRELSDDELDWVTAGTSVSTETIDGMLRFRFDQDNGRGRSVDGEATIGLKEDPLPGPLGALVLRDNAQGNLQALVNVNAVNSLVQVLINLNVNINSTVGVLRQGNLARDL